MSFFLPKQNFSPGSLTHWCKFRPLGSCRKTTTTILMSDSHSFEIIVAPHVFSPLDTKVPAPKCQIYVYPDRAKYALLRKAQVHCPDLSHHHCQDTSLVIQVLSINSRSPIPEERLKMCCLVLLKLTFLSSLKIPRPKFAVLIFWFQRICWAGFPC